MSEMSLAEAIRLGAMATEPGRGGLMTPGGRRCALAAAADACAMPGIQVVDLPSLFVPYNALRARFPILSTIVVHPVDGSERPLYEAIYTLNDINQWTREAIAAWVDTIERAQEPLDPTCDSSEVRTERETLSTAVAHSAPK